MAPLILWSLLVFGLGVLTDVVESQMKTCYFGPPPEPLPGEHWMQAAAREIRKRCPGSRNSTEVSQANVKIEVDISTTASAPRYADCSESYDAGIQYDAVTIYPPQYPNGLAVYCQLDWVVIQNRMDGSVNFTRSWVEYRDGFGDLKGEFWLSNEIVRQLTSEGTWELQILVVGGDRGSRIRLEQFQIAGDNYTLYADPSPKWPTGKSMTDVHSGQPFSTYDRDNDADGNANCAAELKGGWWFKTCTGGVGNMDLMPTNLNGEYSYPVNYTGQDYRGMRWAGALDGGQMSKSSVMIRRGSMN